VEGNRGDSETAYVHTLLCERLEVLHVLQALSGEGTFHHQSDEPHEQPGEAKFHVAFPACLRGGDRVEAIVDDIEDTGGFISAVKFLGQIAFGNRLDHFDAAFAHLEDQPTASSGLPGRSADQLHTLQSALPARQIGGIVEQLNHPVAWQIDEDTDRVFHLTSFRGLLCGQA